MNHFSCQFPTFQLPQPRWIWALAPGAGVGAGSGAAPCADTPGRGAGMDFQLLAPGGRTQLALRVCRCLQNVCPKQQQKNAICDAEYRAFFLCPRIELCQNEISCSFEPVSIATVLYTCDVQAGAVTTSEPGRRSRAPSPRGRQKCISDASVAHFAVCCLCVVPMYNHFIQDYPTHIW